jgi:septin family protein
MKVVHDTVNVDINLMKVVHDTVNVDFNLMKVVHDTVNVVPDEGCSRYG